MFHSFAYVFLAVVPIVQLQAGALIWLVDPSPTVLVSAAGIGLVGTVMFDAGLLLGRSGARGSDPMNDSAHHPTHMESDASKTVAPQEPRPRYTTDRALVILVALALLSLTLFGLRGGFGLVFASRAEMEAALCSVGPAGGLAECGLVMALVHVPPVLLLIAAIGLRRQASTLIAWLALSVGLLATFVTANPASNGRFWAGAVAIGLVGVVIRRSLSARVAFWLLIPALLILVFPTLDFARQRDWTFDLTLHPESLTDKQDFDAFQQISNGVVFVEAFGTQDGAQAAASLLFFVPRGIWPDKAPATGPMVATALGISDNTNVSAPLWEEAYVDFGLGGVALVLGALGLVVSKLETMRKRRSTEGDELLDVTAPFLAGYGVFFLRGPLLPAIGLLAVIVGVILVVRWAGVRERSRILAARHRPPSERNCRRSHPGAPATEGANTPP